MIKPTNGRVMWYHPGGYPNGIVQHDKAQPLTAQVCHVWGDHMVNLDVVDSNGHHHQRTSVPIVQDGSPYTAGPTGTLPYAEWMPYQKGQAAKVDAAERLVTDTPASMSLYCVDCKFTGRALPLDQQVAGRCEIVGCRKALA